MLKKLYSGLMAVIAVGCGLLPVSATADPVSPEIVEVIGKQLSAARPDLQFGDVHTTPIKGLYQIYVNGTQAIYVSADGNYIVDGNMFHARPGMFVPVKDLRIAKIRLEHLSKVATEDMIIFPAAGETKAVLYVFTDVDCGFCRKLHNEALPGLNANGVEVRYLAYPRDYAKAGVNSPSYKKIASAWCAEDPQTALTALKNRQSIPENICEDNPVVEQFNIGQRVGVTGTPALVLADGTLMPGFRPADELLKILGVEPAAPQ